MYICCIYLYTIYSYALIVYYMIPLAQIFYFFLFLSFGFFLNPLMAFSVFVIFSSKFMDKFYNQTGLML